MIYISIGSNLGNRLKHIQTVLSKIKAIGFNVMTVSPVIETRALLPDNAPKEWDQPFLNMVIAGDCVLAPEVLMQRLLQIEIAMGRQATHLKNSPRIIDLDILLYHDLCAEGAALVLPHERLLQRPFLMHLLAMIAPHQVHPVTQSTFLALANQCDMDACFTRSLVASPKLMGIVNITPDSHSDGGVYFDPDKAIAQVLQLHDAGAAVIDIGAQSTRSGAMLITPEEECVRLKPVFDGLCSIIKEKQLIISIDSFNEKTLMQLLEHYPIEWINDQRGALSWGFLADVASSGKRIVSMHALSLPSSKVDVIPVDQDPIVVIKSWAEQRIQQLMQCGFNQSQIIIDPGICFNKTAYQNYGILQQVSQLSELGVEICVGHARKSFINCIQPATPQQRDLETLAVSGFLAEQGVDYLRVYDVKAHQRFLSMQQCLQQRPQLQPMSEPHNALMY